MTKKEEAYLTGHQVQGRILFPATGYLVLVWKLFAQLHQIKDFQLLPVIFQNVLFSRVTVLTKQATVMFRISISDISGSFEIKEGGAVICTGSIKLHDEINELFQVQEEEVNRKESEWRKVLATTPPHLILKRHHIYRKFRLLGYEYSGEFRGIHCSDLNGNNLLLNWNNNNWVSFLDTLIHSTIINTNQEHTELPVEIRKLIISPQELLSHVEILSSQNIKGINIYASNNWYTGNQRCCGVEVIGLRTTPVGSSWHKEPSPCLSTYSFLPYFDDDKTLNNSSTLGPTLQCVAIIVDNLRSDSNLEGLMSTPRIIDMTKRDAETTEALEVSRLLRVHYAIQEVI
jgi:fatty acid synthase